MHNQKIIFFLNLVYFIFNLEKMDSIDYLGRLQSLSGI